MAAGDLIYGTRTVLANLSRLQSLANGQARTFGEVDNSADLAMDYDIHFLVPINTVAVLGTYDFYLVESQDGAEWTDGIDPTADTGDVVEAIKDAILIRGAETIYDNTPTGIRTQVEFHYKMSDRKAFPSKFFGFVMVNNSGQSVPASGEDGDSQSIKIATS